MVVLQFGQFLKRELSDSATHFACRPDLSECPPVAVVRISFVLFFQIDKRWHIAEIPNNRFVARCSNFSGRFSSIHPPLRYTYFE